MNKIFFIKNEGDIINQNKKDLSFNQKKKTNLIIIITFFMNKLIIIKKIYLIL